MMRPRMASLLGALAVVAILSLGPPSVSAANPPNCNPDNMKIAAVPEQMQISVAVATVPDLVVSLNLMPAAPFKESLAIARGSPGNNSALTTDINAMNNGTSTAQSTRSPRQSLAQSLMTMMMRTPGGDLTVDDDTGNRDRDLGANPRASPEPTNSQIDINILPSPG